MNYTPSSLWHSVENFRCKNPLVHNITNYVVMHTVANSLLGAGASPVMAHAFEEIEEITGIASTLSLNIGTLSPAWVDSMKKAVQVASKKGIPIVLDPVGAGASSLRTKVSLELLELIPNPILRGNASEIMAIADKHASTRGVDSTEASTAAKSAGIRLASKYSGLVCISGAEDIITDGSRTIGLRGGSALMPKVTGMGCTASALMAGFACTCPSDGVNYCHSVHKEERLLTALACMGLMSTAGVLAEEKCSGSGTFLAHFIDALGNCTERDFLNKLEIFEA